MGQVEMRYARKLSRFECREESFFSEFMAPVPVDKDRFFSIDRFDFSAEDEHRLASRSVMPMVSVGGQCGETLLGERV